MFKSIVTKAVSSAFRSITPQHESSFQTLRKWTDFDTQDFESFFSKSMHEYQVPGAAIGIVHQNGTLLYHQAFGVKEHGKNEHVTLDTPFLIGSSTKALTTFSMAMLIAQGKLTWETPVTDLLPNFKLADKDLTHKLQIRHMVSAATGVPARSHFIFKFKGVTAEDRLSEMKDIIATTKFGETFQYSNELFMAGGYAAARAYMAENSLENAYEAMMRKCVFEPLQMNNSFIKPQDAITLSAAMPHSIDLHGHQCHIPLDLEASVYSVAPAGAVWSTVQDLSRYLQLEMNNGVLNGKRIISESPLLERRKRGVTVDEKTYYGLGLLTHEEEGVTMVGHNGGTLGFSTELFFIPNKKVGVVILTNAGYAHPFMAAVRQKFFELTFSAKPKAQEMMVQFMKQRDQYVNSVLTNTSFKFENFDGLDELLGEYESPSLGQMKFFKKNDHYEMELHSFSARVGIATDNSGSKFLVLISPPWSGALKFQIDMDMNQLMLNIGQEQHCFSKNRVCSPSLN